jgi:hypothetical protein
LKDGVLGNSWLLWYICWIWGTQGSQVFCMLPLLLRPFILRVSRGRRHSGLAILQRTFGSISVLVITSLGTSESAGEGSALIGPSSGRWGRETKNWWSYKENSKKKSNEQNAVQRNKKGSQHFQFIRCIPLVRGEWSQKKLSYKPEFPSAQSE